MNLPDEKREAIRAEVRLHRSARAVMVQGEVRWICEGCGQPLTPSDPAEAFGDLTTHQADALAPLLAGWLAEAWDEGHEAGSDDMFSTRNPYRAALDADAAETTGGGA